MRIKGVKLEWYAMYWRNGLQNMNVLYGMEEEVAKGIRKKQINSKAELREWLRRKLMYNYWSKSEVEIAVGGLFAKSVEELEKIDIWRQLEPNLERIVEYIIEEMEIDKK